MYYRIHGPYLLDVLHVCLVTLYAPRYTYTELDSTMYICDIDNQKLNSVYSKLNREMQSRSVACCDRGAASRRRAHGTHDSTSRRIENRAQGS